jgi:basic amino acid/polyamine antiporter, APA family
MSISEPAQSLPTPVTRQPALHRSIGLALLVLYGLGVTVGAGIYVLVGVAAERAGPHAPLAFIVAAVVMGFTAASFAELVGRMPVSAGEAAYVHAGFGSRAMAIIVGLLVILAGIVAAAAITAGSVGYIATFIDLPPSLIAVAVLLMMGGIASWGMLTSARVAAVMTLIEIGGLLVIIAVGFWHRPALLMEVGPIFPAPTDTVAWAGVMGAALLAFFAFIGFEGMVNVAEEVHAPERTLPRAIFLTLAISTLLYILVVVVALASVDRAELAATGAPLALVFERVTGAPPHVVSAIAVVATLNGIIAQLVLASRVTYGLAETGSLPAILGRVHPATRTPVLATVLVTGFAIAFVTLLPIAELADLTSSVMLVIFLLVNAALLAIKARSEPAPTGAFVTPIYIPVCGVVSCLVLLVVALL